jgi:DNA-directed RNA polymerase alpha subunit
MNPQLKSIQEEDGVLTFTVTGINTSIANALRRTMISDIPSVVFRTTPHQDNKAVFLVNTTRMNNEILKQRLSCIPIHITDLETPLGDYIVEVNVENRTETIQFVTTEDFKVKNIKTNTYLSEKTTREIFPANDAGYFIDFARLRPQISEELPGEKLHLTCELSLGSPKENSMFNCVSTCAYGFTIDRAEFESQLEKEKKKWESAGMSKDAVEFEAKNWKLLEGQRIVLKDSFDFVVETVGVYENRDIVKKACAILIKKLSEFDQHEVRIVPAQNTMAFSYDIVLENEDYTLGKVLECLMYTKFFEGLEILTFCGFKKMHPHDADSLIRVAYKEVTDIVVIRQNLKACTVDAIAIFAKIADRF